jgi:hypothetical protein
MQASNSTSTRISRNQYGALCPANVLTPDQLQQLSALRDAAVKAGKLPAPFILGDRKEFECLNLDIFDVQLFRGKVKGLVVQARTFWKDLRKGYTRTGKEYFLVLKSGRTIDVTTIDSATCAKRAKNTVALGELAAHYQGKVVVKCKAPSIRTWTGFKVLAQDDAGQLVSAYDDSTYCVGKWRSQAAREDHGGGFYYYLNQQLAIDATSRGETFADCVSEGKRLVLCEVEVSGREIEYNAGKWASSRLRVIRELQPVEILADAET